MTARFEPGSLEQEIIAAIRRAARQEQFLEVVSAEEAQARFAKHLDLSPLAGETVALPDALGRVLARDVIAPIDVPPFDRANVDGFALRAADTLGASAGAPRRLRLNGEVIVCGHAPALEVAPGSATTIATGGMLPRGADAVVMIEHTELAEEMKKVLTSLSFEIKTEIRFIPSDTAVVKPDVKSSVKTRRKRDSEPDDQGPDRP